MIKPSLHKYKRRPSATDASTPRKKPHDYEGIEQAQIIRWIHGECKRGTLPSIVAEMIYAVPNGGHRHMSVAKKLKDQGARAGVSDLVLPIARGGYFGLYLELKATPPHHATVSKSQVEWLRLVQQEGYAGCLAYGKEQAKEMIRVYMNLPVTRQMLLPSRMTDYEFASEEIKCDQ